MSKPYYVTLTGGRNNAGDFLIKYRAFNLFKTLRADRDIIDYNEWEEIDDKKLDIINHAKALILLGGPGLVYNMYPNGAYKLRKNLDDIKVPIIMMGIGWKDPQGDWKDTYTYKISDSSLKLLDKIENSGYSSSVRDYHTLNALQIKGYKNFIMTGCPAYYDIAYLNKNRELNLNLIQKVAFSLGVSFVDNDLMEKQMKRVILVLKEKFLDKLEVVFHHSLDKNIIEKVYGKSSEKHYLEHKKISKWLTKNNIDYIDISGNAENLINYYSKVDLHIGYRVHAHIFMNSISKYSILLNEDGRGKGVEKVLGGTTLNSYFEYRRDFFSKLLDKIFKKNNRMKLNPYIIDELLNFIDYENSTNFQSSKRASSLIDNNFNIMKKFIKQLP